MSYFKETKTNTEYHSNKQLAYVETIAVLEPSTAHLFPYRLISPEGYEWIRIGKQQKYHANGVLAWETNYDDKGEVIKKLRSPNRRKDGSFIAY